MKRATDTSKAITKKVKPMTIEDIKKAKAIDKSFSQRKAKKK